jgi:hypothetical protein
LRDGESIPEAERAHIIRCAACNTLLDEARVRADLIRDVLTDGAAPIDVERAKAAVRARLDESRARSGFPVIGSSLRRAAAILLVTAGAVSALQSPPVRTWLAERFAGNPADGHQPVATATVADELRSIGVPPRSGLVIALSGMEAGTRLAVVFEARGDVEVSGAEGTRFAIADNRVAASDVVGPVVVRVPEGAPSLTISADGRMMFTGTESQHEVHASGVQADGGWVFRIPQS